MGQGSRDLVPVPPRPSTGLSARYERRVRGRCAAEGRPPFVPRPFAASSSVIAGTASARYSVSSSACRTYSRRQRPSTVTVIPSAPPSLVVPMLRRAPASIMRASPSTTPSVARSSTTSTACPLPPPSSQLPSTELIRLRLHALDVQQPRRRCAVAAHRLAEERELDGAVPH